MDIAAAVILILIALVGVILSLASLPGTWVMLLCALIVEFWRPDVLSWRTIGIIGGIALASEVVDAVASAMGAKKAGGTRRAAWGAVIGAIVGAILGTPLIPIPVVGTIIGAVVGAGLLAGALDLTKRETFDDAMGLRTAPMDVRRAFKVGSGAAIGRLVSVVIKSLLALGAAAVLTAAALMS